MSLFKHRRAAGDAGGAGPTEAHAPAAPVAIAAPEESRPDTQAPGLPADGPATVAELQAVRDRWLRGQAAKERGWASEVQAAKAEQALAELEHRAGQLRVHLVAIAPALLDGLPLLAPVRRGASQSPTASHLRDHLYGLVGDEGLAGRYTTAAAGALLLLVQEWEGAIAGGSPEAPALEAAFWAQLEAAEACSRRETGPATPLDV